MNIKEYIIFAAIAAVVVTIMEAIVPGTLSKIVTGIVVMLFVKYVVMAQEKKENIIGHFSVLFFCY